jgi:AcrR family transcriptional regulator
MPRVVKEYTVRRDEILDAGEQLIYTRGYKQMSIQEIMDALYIAKGTFYHYFDSKQALLEAVVDRMLDRQLKVVSQVVNDPGLTAPEKLRQFAATMNRWKTTQKIFLIRLVRAWYTDENALVREKVRTGGTRHFGPLLSTIIRQGIEEGTLTTPYPDQAGELILAIIGDLEAHLPQMLVVDQPSPQAIDRILLTAAALNDALERVLGAPPDSLNMIDIEKLKEWFVVSEGSG